MCSMCASVQRLLHCYVNTFLCLYLLPICVFVRTPELTASLHPACALPVPHAALHALPNRMHARRRTHVCHACATCCIACPAAPFYICQRQQHCGRPWGQPGAVGVEGGGCVQHHGHHSYWGQNQCHQHDSNT